MKIYLPHIHYTVLVKDISLYRGDPERGNAFCVRVDKNTSEVFIKTPVKVTDFPTLGHELVHVLKNICDDRNMNFLEETEHMGYVMQYLLCQVMGLKYQ